MVAQQYCYAVLADEKNSQALELGILTTPDCEKP
jgi:hypothetical protein